MIDLVLFIKKLKEKLGNSCETYVDAETNSLTVLSEVKTEKYDLDNLKTTEDTEELMQEILNDLKESKRGNVLKELEPIAKLLKNKQEIL